MWEKTVKLFRLLNSQSIYPGFWQHGEMAQFRALANRARFRGKPAVLRSLYSGILILYSPFRAFYLSLQHTSRVGQRIQRLAGISCFRQFCEQYYLVLIEQIPPRSYYQFQLYDPERWAQRSGYLHDGEAQAIFRVLNGFASNPVINDKHQFALFCEKAGLPVPETIAVYPGNHFKHAVAFPPGDLFVKPLHGCRGEGAEYWTWNEDGTYCYKSFCCDADALHDRLNESGSKRALLVQSVLSNHEDLARLSNGFLVTLRLVTARNLEGEIELLFALCQIPVGLQSISHKGLSAPVSLQAGCLQAPFSWRPGDSVSELAASDQLIKGSQIPYWQATRDLVCRAHALLGGYFSLGWDVAITADGPVLLEANEGWEVTMVQKVYGPAGSSVLKPLIDAHVEKLAL